jgi:rhamnulokinase
MACHVAVDVGSNGGKVTAGGRTGDSLRMAEVYRFDNGPVERGDRFVWDIEYIVEEVSAGIEAAEDEFGAIDTVAVDTTALDIGFYADGELIRDPYCYRDPSVTSTLPDILSTVSRREVFMATGINHWNVPNSLWQYHYQHREEPEIVERADSLVTLPQLVSERLGGTVEPDRSIATTTQMYDIEGDRWAVGLLEALELPTDLLPPVRDIGEVVGSIDPGVVDVSGEPDIVLPASHDTGSAVAGIPFDSEVHTFLATGSWFIPGIELDEPQVTEAAFEADVSNEYGAEDTTRFLKDVTGFNLLESCREKWEAEGKPYRYGELFAAMDDTEAFGPIIDPDAERFTAGKLEGDIVERIQSFCRETDQAIPEGVGELARCLYESLAAKTAVTLAEIQSAAGVESDRLNMVGGGVRNERFCRMVASATDLPVTAGPVEATAAGNLLVQLKSAGEIDDIAEGRRLVRETFSLSTYEPSAPDEWEPTLAEMRRLSSD